MSNLNYYVGGELIGASTSVNIPTEKHKWEFYLRRRDFYYFRRVGRRIKVELNFLGAKEQEFKRLKYGTFYKIDYNIEKQADESRVKDV